MFADLHKVITRTRDKVAQSRETTCMAESGQAPVRTGSQSRNPGLSKARVAPQVRVLIGCPDTPTNK